MPKPGARDYSRPWPERIAQSAERNNKTSRARYNAFARLRELHPRDYQRLYAEEKAKELRG